MVCLPDTIGKDATPNAEEEDNEFNDENEEFEVQVDRFLDDTEEDQEDAPDWLLEKGKTLAKSKMYVFCPALHRAQLLQLFLCHFFQHPMLFERLKSKKWTKEQIHTNAVHKMYFFCKQWGLREAWAYFWNNWYSPSRWPLWACSTSTYLPRQQTTMGVENFWWQLKREFLHNVPRPSIDQLVFILINKVTPAYFARFSTYGSTYAPGISKPLTPAQRMLKKSWNTLAK